MKLLKRKALLLVAASVALAQRPGLAVVKDWNASGGNWNTSGNWLPNGTPGSLDSVFIGSTASASNATVMLNVSQSVAALTINDGMTLDTNFQSLLVGTTANVAGQNVVGTTTFNSRLQVDGNVGSFSFKTLNNLNVTDHARIDMVGGKLEVGSTLFVDATSRLAGTGTVNFTGAPASVMTMDGYLEVGVGSMTLNQQGTGKFDLDGGAIGDRRIDVTAGDFITHKYASLTINGDGLADDYDDSLRIGGKNSVNINLSNGWTMSTGTLEFSDNIVDPGAAQPNGSHLTLNADLAVIGTNSWGQINCPIDFTGSMTATVNTGNRLQVTNSAKIFNGSSVTVAKNAYASFEGSTIVNGGTFSSFSTNASEGSITFAGPTTYSGTINMHGVASQDGDVTVGNSTVINADVLDMDGFTGNTTWNVTNSLTINAGTLDANALGPAFDGTMNLSHAGGIFGTQGALTVNLPAGQSWTMAGTMNVTANSLGSVAVTLAGSPVHLAGISTFGYNNSSVARMSFEVGSDTNILTFSGLQLNGGSNSSPNEMNGGLIQGTGVLSASSGHPLVGYGAITCNIDFDTGADLYADLGGLNLVGTINHVGVIGTKSNSGNLNVVNAWNTNVATALELNGGTISGGTITNGGNTYGKGIIKSQGFLNEGFLQVFPGGSLTIDTVNAPDLDGNSGAGAINVGADTLRIVKAPTDAFDGTATVNYASTLQLDSGWTLNNAGTLSLNGLALYPATVAGSQQLVLGHVNVTKKANFDIGTTFAGSAAVSIPTVNDQLTLLKDSIIGATVAISGNGTLRVDPGVTLTPATNAGINVYFENAGKTVIAGAAAAGIVGAKIYSQPSTGQLAIDIGGTIAGAQFDKLNVTNDAFLGGNLLLSTFNGYSPAYLTPHEILHSGAILSGHFGTVSGFALSPTKFLAVTYQPHGVLVQAALPGDASLDGKVDSLDFNALATNFGTTGDTWVTGDFNGDGKVDSLDFNALATNFGTSIPAADMPTEISAPGVVMPSVVPTIAPTVVPEPGMLSLVALLAGGLMRRRTRRR